ncbi:MULTISPECIES: LacI family DNA-binding transcriptional regulator, partial [unclassified Arthrobacter]
GAAPSPVEFADFTTVGAAEATRRLLDAAPGTDAIFAASDLMAVGVLEVLRSRGLRVPDDVAVVGYDNHSIAALASPALSTITQPMVEMATKAGAMLLEEIEAPGTHPDPVVYPAELVVRSSSAPRAAATKA